MIFRYRTGPRFRGGDGFLAKECQPQAVAAEVRRTLGPSSGATVQDIQSELRITLSGLTAIAGFGSLILAKHKGIESLGWVMSVGVATCMVVALTLVPAVLNVLNQYGWSIKKPSGTMHDPHWVGRNRGNNLKSESSLDNVTEKSNLI